jgi:Superfamily II DNA and RNA helicases
MKTSFNTYELSDATMRALAKMGFADPTPVQKRAIGPMIEGKDLIVQAPTGTGKTGAFGIPAVEAIDTDSDRIQAVVICPTRELALQITEVLRRLAVYKEGLRIMAIFGGEPIERQITALRKRPQIIVATPGRLIDHINRRTCRLDHVGIVILDEADRMLDMGFRGDIDKILKATPQQRQTVLFSATMQREILALAKQYQKDTKIITVDTDRPIDTVQQYYMNTENKTPMLFDLLKEKRFGLSLVFVATKRRADRIARQLCKNGFNAGAIHGDLNQNQRNRVMDRYRNRKIDILVATDVAARGIDVDCIDAVINYDMPADVDSYTHRIGRSGRAGESGEAYSFVRGEDQQLLRDIISETHAEINLIGSKQIITPFARIEPANGTVANTFAKGQYA